MATFNASVAASGDDALWIPSSSTFDATFTEVIVGKPGAVGNVSTHFFLRVDNVTIPQGATVSAVTWTLIASANLSDTTVNATIACVDADDAAAPTTSAGAEALTLTSATVAWNNIAAITSGNSYSPPDLATLVQEVVDRPGWVSGNALVFVFKDNGSTATGNAARSFASWDHATLAAPALEITYSMALSGTIAATSGAGGDLTATASLAGTAGGEAAASANLTAGAGQLAGTVAAQSATAADLSATAALAGTAGGEAAASANLAAGQMLLAGQAVAQSSASGSLAVRAELAGATAGLAAGTADLRLLQAISATASSSASLTASLTATATLAGTSGGLAALAGALTGGDITLPRRAVLADARAHYLLDDGRSHYALRDARPHYILVRARQ